MSMSTHVIGFKPPNAKWKKMKKAWDACVAANVGLPLEVDEFFDGSVPDDNGVEVRLKDEDCCIERRAERHGLKGSVLSAFMDKIHKGGQEIL